MTQAKYPKKVLLLEGEIVHIGRLPDKHADVGDDHHYSALDKVVLDNYLLSFTNELIITPHSSFGVVAALRGNRVPLESWSCKPFIIHGMYIFEQDKKM